MLDFNKDFIVYSAFCPNLKLKFKELDILEEIRKKFFETNKQQKNKVTRNINNETFHFSYDLEKSKPLRFKSVKNNRVIAKTILNSDGSYFVLHQDENQIPIKKIYFSKEHSWQKTAYFEKSKHQPFIIFELTSSGIIYSIIDKKTGERFLHRLIEIKDYPNMQNSAEFIINSAHGNFYFAREDTPLKEIQKNDLNKIKPQQILPAIDKTSETNKITSSEKIIQNPSQEKFKEINGNSLNKNEQSTYLYENDIYENTDIKIFPNCSFDENGCPFLKENKKIIKTEKNEKYFYFGQMEKNMRCGYGRTLTNDGMTTYEGEYKNDKKDGFGVFYYKNGKPCYVGNFKENKKHGCGVSFKKEANDIQFNVWENDNTLNFTASFDENGQVSLNKKNSQNKENILKIEIDNLREEIIIKKTCGTHTKDYGTIVDFSGHLLYSGELFKNIRDGHGIEYYNGFKKYVGMWKNNLYWGKGKIYSDKNEKIEAIFENGEVSGVANIYNKIGEKIYHGEFLNGHPSGEGKKYFNDGSYRIATFEKGIEVGKVFDYNSKDKLVFEGEIKENLYEGNGILFEDGEKIYKGQFSKGLFDGFGTLFEKGNIVYSGEFKNNERCGFGKSFEKNGTSYIGEFEKNKFNGIGIIFKNDKPIFVGKFKENKKCGRINEIYENKVIKECIFNEDSLIYENEYCWPNMNLIYCGNVQNGLKNGMGCAFSEFGERTEEGIFNNGKLASSMKILIKTLEPLPSCKALEEFGYNHFRKADEFCIEKAMLGGLYSGKLKNSLPNGKGTILYNDHKYIGEFENGKACGCGKMFTNDGKSYEAEFLKENENDAKTIEFENNIKYFIKQKIDLV